MIKVSNNLKKGDLAMYKGSQDKNFCACLVLDIMPVLGSGFQSARILWCDTNDEELILLQYLEPISRN